MHIYTVVVHKQDAIQGKEPIVMGKKGKRRMARPESWLCKYPSCEETITVEIQRQTIARRAIVSHLYMCLTTITCSSCPSCSEPCLCAHIIMRGSEIVIVHCFNLNESSAACAGSPSLTLSEFYKLFDWHNMENDEKYILQNTYIQFLYLLIFW